MNAKYLIFVFFVLFLSMSVISANELNQNNATSLNDDSSMEIVNYHDETNLNNDYLQVYSQEVISNDNEFIVVNNWEELQYYCTQSDKNYNLKLKENTNFYPSTPTDVNSQIKIKNNVKIIGSEGSWFGDSSSDAVKLKFLPIVVENDERVGLTLENITFKWINAGGSTNLPDGMFIKIGGKKNTIIKNCIFQDIQTTVGHSCIVHLSKGTMTLDNCSFIRCNTNYGCLSVYGSSPHMTVQNCYFENNYAKTEPGCINNCGKLTVYNTTFYKNRAGSWAGAIHTHSGASSTIYDSNFIDNVAGWNGGALYTYGNLKIYNSIFRGNNCTTDNGGGAIGACQYGSNPHIYIEGCLFEDNANNCWAPDSLSDGVGRGGAISIMDKGSLEVRDTTFIENSAARGSAICALAVEGYGTPDVIIVNNSFINHVRSDDVLNIKLWNESFCNISDNYYLGNSIVFSNLKLTKLSEGKEQAFFEISNSLTHPDWYDSDILNKTLYDVYINNNYVKTVNSTIFSIDFENLDICNVYVIPTISNRKSNEVTATSTREYIFVSKNKGNDTNNGISRDSPVSSIKKALELAQNYQNIILLDGEYSEDNILITYDVTIKGEGNATLTGATSFISNANLTLKNLKINNLNTETFIKNNNNLIIANCILTNNNALLVQNNGAITISNSILLNNSKIIQGNDANLDYNWWGNSIPNLNISKYLTLNITSDVDALENNQKANVKAVFYLNDGTKYTNLPQIDLNLTAINGIVNKYVTDVDSNVIYTLTAFGDGILTVGYNDFTTSKTFEFLKTDPKISLSCDDIMVGDNLIITVTLPNDAEGNLTVNVGISSQTKVIDSSKMIFTFENLKADSYTGTVNYTGDKKYQSKAVTSNVNVNKFESTTNLTIGTVNVGEDVILTITTTDSTTGNVTLLINNNPHTVFLTNSKGEYTIENIVRGDYLITAVYNGDDRYLSSQTSRFIEVDNLNASMKIETNDITYGDTAIIKIKLNDDATGNVTVTIDGIRNSSAVVNGRAEVTLNNLEAGQNKNISVFYTGDDTYFNLTNTSSFNINKADLKFNISFSDIKIGQTAEISIIVPSKTRGTFTINNETINIPLSGEVSYLIFNLEIGNYTFTATYNGNNYNTVSKSVSFEVSEYPIPQWAGEGGNTENTHKTIYESSTDGTIAYTVQFDKTLTGELLLDSMGNIYLTTKDGIYCYNQKDCLWYFTSDMAAGNFSGICIGRDVIIAPKSGDTLYFINQTSGERYGASNIYQGSSLFAPVIDSNATLYIVSEYQYTSEDYKLTIIPYKLWENGGDPTLVTIGDTQPLCSPTLNENIIVVVSENRLRMINAKTLETISIKGGEYSPVRPVIGDGDIVYAVSSDSIVAYNIAGVQLWKTKVVGGVGNTLVIDPEQGVYHVNARGILYRFDILDGSDSKISNLKVTSGILIDNDSNLYFASGNVFYAIDKDGNVLWQSDLGSKITGTPVMNKEGVIYVTCEDNKLFALSSNNLKDPNLEVTINNITEGENTTISISINNQATGNVSFTLDNVDYSFKASEGNFVKIISDLKAGDYSVNVTYSGDSIFGRANKVVSFNVALKTSLRDPELEVSVPNITQGENATIIIKIDNGTTGNVSFALDGVDYSFDVSNGTIICQVPNLKAGTYTIDVTYSGDSRFNKTVKRVTFTVKSDVVPLPNPDLAVSIPDITQGENAVITIKINNETTGKVSFTLNGVDYSFETGNGTIIKVISNLPAGTYTVNVTYSGDLTFNRTSKVVTFTVKAKPSPLIQDLILKGSDISVLYTSNSYYKVKLTQNNAPLAGKTIAINFNGANYNIITDKKGIASFKITAKPGKYTIKASYQGKVTQNTVTVKSILKAKNIKAKKSAKSLKIKVTLKKVNNKYLKNKVLTLKFNKKTFKAKTNKKGVVTFKIKRSVYKKLKTSKKYAYLVTYKNDAVRKTIKFKK
jgi:hypothetical protein